MIANALLFAVMAMLAYLFWLFDELRFIASYKTAIFDAYGRTLLIFAAILFLNLFGLALAVGRRLFLKNTGRKLRHLDRQFHVGQLDMPIPAKDLEAP